jgi:hypothetical protein
MSLIDNVRQSLGEAASTAREVGQNLGSQAQAQINIKKMQLEHTRKLRDLGEKTYDWYQSGQMIVTGEIPFDVRALCVELDDSSTRLRLEEAKLEEARLQAAARAQNKDEQPSTYSVLPENNGLTTNMNTPTTNTPTTNTNTPHAAHAGHAVHAAGGVVMPGTGIVTNPTPPVSAPETIPTAVPPFAPTGTSGGTNISGDDAPVVPVSDLAPSPHGDTTIGGGTMPGAPGTSDTMGGGMSGGGFGGATM